ncbi:E3 SUMO-protein ligase KIAA1586-like [Aphis craccivora]|uniref:E3 SUMO-protein ligase KIAA1586-like n=1 Tax=Aphis craccivora TaxID=307492 RepID=A0A6G0Y6R2_APHCR|nr:E3 SUMO-protein ligase KIAA1586-like [Aphis craccivora]
MRAQSDMCRTIRILESLKTEPGTSITITKSGGINRLQFLQNIVDRIRQRLFNDLKNTTILQDLKVIGEVFKTETDDDRGEEEVNRVSRRFGLSEFESLVNFRSRNASSDLIKRS